MDAQLDDLQELWEQLRTRGPRLAFQEALDKISRSILGFSPVRYSRITPQIILGGQPAASALTDLARAGVTGVVNMRDEYDYESELDGLNLHYLRLATIDNTPPSLEHLKQGVEFIRREIDAGGSVYIHCWGGLGRGPTMVAAYFVSQGMPSGDAWDKIRAIRPFIRPTQGQITQIQKFAALYYTPQPDPVREVKVTEIKTT